MKRTLAIAIAITAVGLAACDSGAPAAPTKPAAPVAAPPPPPPPPPAPTGMPGLSEPYATEADFVAACSAPEVKIPASVCTCVAKATIKEVGQQALYQWVWEGYVTRSGLGKVRSDKWFADNNLDKAKQQKFADAVGKCYVTQ